MFFFFFFFFFLFGIVTKNPYLFSQQKALPKNDCDERNKSI